MEEKSVKTEKLSYEQLENAAHQLSEQNRQLYMRVQQLELTNVFKRLDYLFKVVENKQAFKKEFLDTCTNEIETLMEIKDQESNKESNEEGQ